jgi:hypothetical protein
VFRPCLAPCDQRPVAPEGTTVLDRGGSGGLPKEPPRPHPRRATKGMPVDPPREEVHRVGPTPEGVRLPTSSRRISEETRARPSADSEERRPVVRAPSLLPSAVARVHEERPLAADVHTRRCARLRATRAHLASEEGACCAEPVTRIPKDASGGRARRRHPEVGPLRTRGSGISSKLERRLRARQSSCSPGRPRLDPKTKSLPRSEDRIDRRRSAVGAVGPHIPPFGGDPPRAPGCPRRDGP